MNELVTAITTGLIAFIATNIDDIVILLLFFSRINANFRPRHIVAGQFLGFTVLLILSLPGLFGGLVLSKNWIGLLGLLPMSIGISSLVNREEDSSKEVVAVTEETEKSTITSFFSPQAYSVAAVTIANGSDNISVYVPLFASSNLESFVVIIGLFFLLLGIWCYVAYKLTNYRVIANVLTRYINNLVPFILIGLGAFIVLESQALSLIKLGASCLCLMILVKNNESADEIGENSSR
ncbi:transporter [Nostoc sp. 'Peltigera membranacea cyanobiont' 213]|uniref:cadmium resistance transporter n=1 Tax=Nostoc sp. 'Peltigera membranacea cyanobiont' 213 TaxID=2014530 RepID=UPI000B95A95A|nr:cadmium resistance transporter [Nostoc sp. 'Peltigera membranacea cyanobiont' 213]OYD87347.1 transporter [Nostoc sp. 'Peltigera membranacea cyanobiont' 213]